MCSNKSSFKLIIYLILLVIVSRNQHIRACGGGVMPYIPTNTNSASDQKAEFFLIEKGITSEIFDTKKLQPVFKNIVNTGNRRKVRTLRSSEDLNMRTKQDGRANKYSNDTEIDSVQNVQPVLNLHRLH